MRFFKSSFFLCLMVLMACQEEAKPTFPQPKLSINDSGEITFTDSVFFISTDTIERRITIIPEVEDVQLFYSVNARPLVTSQALSLLLQEQDTLLRFYLAKEGFKDSAIKTLVIQPNSAEFLENIKLPESQSDSGSLITVSDKSRGLLTFEIFTRWGKIILQQTHFKSSETLKIPFELKGNPSGVYFGRLSYGNDHQAFKVVWEE